ncbi:HAD family hydrolase [Glycomyces paridis]|uniref:HAD family phosphatase n=1 Tax=Glycomyces paridis TaxID=2126555 RepID=A0A4S8PC08_9ACTN|nr:HAD family hydrolase [Glycomyces paridis]THV26692.1 HAD family phosphatase [Glycomyces paridis]
MLECSVIATDLDGTLLGRGRLLTERTRKALIAARERGIAVVAATARTPRGLAAVPGLAETVDAAICNNGAILYEPSTGAVDVRRTIDADAVRLLHERLLTALPDASFAIESGTAVYAQAAHIPSRPDYDDPWHRVDTLDAALAAAGRVVEYRLLDRETGPAGMLAAAGHVTVPGVVQWTWRDYPVFEYNAEGVSKGGALAEWCAERGIGPASVTAFGDAANDVPMLAWAGRSYAMAGAPPEVAAAADLRAPANTEDGVAQVIEALLEPFAPPV